MIRFVDLSEEPDLSTSPWLDRPGMQKFAHANSNEAFWRDNGYLILPKLLPDDFIDAYCEKRAKMGAGPGDWPVPTPYEHISEMRDLALYKPLRDAMGSLIAEDMMLHLCLSGWVSTERNWHQDDYLNPPHVNSWYIAAWMALDDIHPDSGPFEYVPGSHTWPVLRGDLVRARMNKDQANSPSWPSLSQSFVAAACEAEINRRGARIKQFIAKKGDVLLWHGRLMHRGTEPRNRSLLRKTLIAHYSGVGHRSDMPGRANHKGGVYAVFNRPLVQTAGNTTR